MPAPPPVKNPANFLEALLCVLDTAMRGNHPVTRWGLEQAMDAVFSLPELTPLLDDPVRYQNGFASRQLPACCAEFRPFWEHIICPAWNQHADIRRVCAATAADPSAV